MLYRALAMVSAIVAAMITAGIVSLFELHGAVALIGVAGIAGALSGYVIGGKYQAPPPGAYLRDDPPTTPRMNRWLRIFK